MRTPRIPLASELLVIGAMVAGCNTDNIAPGVECSPEGRAKFELRIKDAVGDIAESPEAMMQELGCYVDDGTEQFAELSKAGEMTGDQMRDNVHMQMETFAIGTATYLDEPIGGGAWVFNCEDSDELGIGFNYEDPDGVCVLILERDFPIANKVGFAFSAEYETSWPNKGDELGWIPMQIGSTNITHEIGNLDAYFDGELKEVTVDEADFNEWTGERESY